MLSLPGGCGDDDGSGPDTAHDAGRAPDAGTRVAAYPLGDDATALPGSGVQMTGAVLNPTPGAERAAHGANARAAALAETQRTLDLLSAALVARTSELDGRDLAPTVIAVLEGPDVAEAMAASQLGQATPPASLASAGWSDGYALLAVGGGLHAVLGTLEEPDPPHGTPRLASRERYLVHASIPDAARPAVTEPFRHARVEVVTDTGARCAGRVVRFEYRVDLISDWDEVEYDYTGADPRDASAPAPTRLRGAALAASIWRQTSQRMISARLRLDDTATCSGTPLYARRLDAPDSRVALEQSDVPHAAAVLDAFAALPGYAINQALHEQATAQSLDDAPMTATRWDHDGREPVVQAFAFAGEPTTLVSVSVPAWGCGDDLAPLWAVFRVEPAADAGAAASVSLVHTSSAHAPPSVRLVLDAGNGRLDFLVDDEGFGGGLHVLSDQRSLASWSTEFHGCGC